MVIIFQVGKAELKDGSLSLDVLDWDFTCYRKIGNIQVIETNHTYHLFAICVILHPNTLLQYLTFYILTLLQY